MVVVFFGASNHAAEGDPLIALLLQSERKVGDAPRQHQTPALFVVGPSPVTQTHSEREAAEMSTFKPEGTCTGPAYEHTYPALAYGHHVIHWWLCHFIVNMKDFEIQRD